MVGKVDKENRRRKERSTAGVQEANASVQVQLVKVWIGLNRWDCSRELVVAYISAQTRRVSKKGSSG